MSNTIYQDKHRKLIFRGTLVVLISKQKTFEDKHFSSLTEAKKYLGV